MLSAKGCERNRAAQTEAEMHLLLSSVCNKHSSIADLPYAMQLFASADAFV